LNVRNCRNRQVLFGGSGGKRDGGSNVIRFQAREIGKNVFGGISDRQAGEYCAQGDTRALEDRLASTDSSVAYDAFFIIFQITGCAAHVIDLDFAWLIIQLGAAYMPVIT